MYAVQQLDELFQIINTKWDLVQSGQMQTLMIETPADDLLLDKVSEHLRQLAGSPNQFEYDLRANRQEPFYPFMQVIKESLAHCQWEEQEKRIRTHVYPAFQTLFEEYLLPGFVQTTELLYLRDIAIDQVDYEEFEMMRSISTLIYEQSKDAPLMVYLQGLEWSSPSTFKMIEHLLTNGNPNSRILLLFHTMHSDDATANQNASHFQAFLDASFSNISVYAIMESVNIGPREIVIPKRRKQLPFPDRIQQAHVNMMFYNLKESIDELSKIIANNSFLSMVQSAPGLFMKACLTLGDAYLYSREYDFAQHYYHKILEQFRSTLSNRDQALIYRKITVTHLCKSNVADAQKQIQMSMHFANLSFDQNEIIYSYFLQYSMQLDDAFTTNDMRAQGMMKFKSMVEKTPYEHLMHRILGSHLYDATFFQTHKQRVDYLGVRIAQLTKSRNIEYLSGMYHSASMVLRDERDKSMAFLKKSIETRRKLPNKQPLASSINALGYHQLTSGEFVEANESYFEALELLIHVKNFREVFITLYNIAVCFFFYRNFREAAIYFEYAVKIVNVLKLTNLPYHTISGVYALLGISYFKSNDKFKALNCLKQINANPETPHQEEQMFIKLLRAYLTLHSAESDQLIEEVERIGRNEPWQLWKYFVCDHVGSFWWSKGDFHTARMFWSEGIEFATNDQMSFFKEYFTSEINQTKFTPKRMRIRSKVHLDFFIFQANQIVASNQLQKKSSEINLLHRVQLAFQNKSNRVIELYQEIEQVLKSIYIFDQIQFVFLYDGHLKMEYPQTAPTWFNIDHANQIYLDVLDKRGPFMKKPLQVQEHVPTLLVVPLMSHDDPFGYISIAIDEHVFTDEDYQIVHLLSKELSTQFFNHMLEHEITAQNIRMQQAYFSMSNLMNNVDQGFLMFGADQCVLDQYSKKCIDFFGRPIETIKFSDLLFENAAERRMYDQIIQSVFQNLSDNKTSVYFHLLIDSYSELHVNDLILNFRYKVIRDFNQDNTPLLLVIISDVTQTRALQAELDRESNSLRMIVKIAQNKKEIQQTIRSFEHFLDVELLDMIQQPLNFQQIYEDVFRKIHTFKGSFSQYQFQKLARELHDVEDRLTAVEEASIEALNETFQLLDSIHESISPEELLRILEDEKQLIRQTLGDAYFTEQGHVQVDQNQLDQSLQLLLSQIPKEHHALLESTFQSLHHVPLASMLDRYVTYVDELSVALEKKINPLIIRGGEQRIDPKRFTDFFQSLVHVFRNIVDHAIEDPVHREKIGKTAFGNIDCTFRTAQHEFVLEIRDDGSGIDRDRIIEKAIEKGLCTPQQAEHFSIEEVIEFIFADDFSTKDEISTYSGRGVGLAAVKKAVESLTGSLQVESQFGHGTTFRFRIPFLESDALNMITSG